MFNGWAAPRAGREVVFTAAVNWSCADGHNRESFWVTVGEQGQPSRCEVWPSDANDYECGCGM